MRSSWTLFRRERAEPDALGYDGIEKRFQAFPCYQGSFFELSLSIGYHNRSASKHGVLGEGFLAKGNRVSRPRRSYLVRHTLADTLFLHDYKCVCTTILRLSRNVRFDVHTLTTIMTSCYSSCIYLIMADIIIKILLYFFYRLTNVKVRDTEELFVLHELYTAAGPTSTRGFYPAPRNLQSFFQGRSKTILIH